MSVFVGIKWLDLQMIKKKEPSKKSNYWSGFLRVFFQKFFNGF